MMTAAPEAGRAQVPQDVEPRPLREHDVEDDEVGRLGLNAARSRVTVRCGDDDVALPYEVRTDDVDDVRFVIDDEDVCHGWSMADGRACEQVRPSP